MKFPYNKALEIKKRYQNGELAREEAKEQLAYLLDLTDDNDFCEDAVKAQAETGRGDYWLSNFRSYGPLVRLSDVCNILRVWARVNSTELPDESEYTKEGRRRFAEAWRFIDLQISKSCLLDRLFFQAENLRSVPCPVHKGRWGGCNWDTPGCACRNGANVTGWLPIEESTGYSDDPNAPLCDFCGKPPLKQGLWSFRVDKKRGHSECMDAHPMQRITSKN